MSRLVKPAPVIAILVFLGIVGAGIYLLLKDTQKPELALIPELVAVSPSRLLTVQASDRDSGIKSLSVRVTQGSRQAAILDRQYTTLLYQVEEQFSLSDAGLTNGPFTLDLTAVDSSLTGFGTGNIATISIQLVLDTTPPTISVQSTAHNIRRGGTGCVIYTLSDDANQSGVQAGDLFFPGYKQNNGDYYCLFAYPYFMDAESFQPRLTATDLAGNQAVRGFRYHLLDQEFKEDSIHLSDSFLNSKMPEFEAQVPGQMTNLERYLKVNRDLRLANRTTLLSIGRMTSPRQLWQGAFIRMPGATMAGFGDHRSYIYQGQEVDKQTHLGVDIASTEHAPVPAANAGEVVFAGDMGIYGQAVIIDHGLGLQSLHAHLSRIDVKPKDKVERGQAVGLSGMTGLAGGDHLHLGILVSGLPVTPVEWWDERWIRHNVTDRMGEATP